MAGYRGKNGRRSVRVKTLIYENLIQNPDGLTTEQLFQIIKRSSVGRYVASTRSLAQTVRITKGVKEMEKHYLTGMDKGYYITVWVMADPQAFLDWYGGDE